MDLRSLIRDVADFPKPGVVFKDITPLLASPTGFAVAIDVLAAAWRGQGITKVVGIESRGFLLAAPVALALGAGLIPLRKPGKLPFARRRQAYDLEYGSDAIEMHADALGAHDRVLLIDDVLATGGTMQAALQLVASSGAAVVGVGVLIDLAFLAGAARLRVPLSCVLRYADPAGPARVGEPTALPAGAPHD